MSWAMVLALIVADQGDEAQLRHPVVQTERSDPIVDLESRTRLVTLVLPLAPKRVDPMLAETLSGIVASQLARRDELKVVTLETVEAITQMEVLKDAAGCDDLGCAAEIAGALDADRVLMGSVGRVASGYSIILRWIDANNSETLEVESDLVPGGEAELPPVTRRLVKKLLDGSATVDDLALQSKQAPTFFTAEILGGLGGRSGGEPYSLATNTTLRLSWGGLWPTAGAYFYLVTGFGVSHAFGSTDSATGTLRYNRTQLNPFAEVRAAYPIAFGNRLRIYGGVGGGADFERHEIDRHGQTESRGWASYGELRVLAGIWYRFSYRHSIYGGYRLRAVFGGDGADPITERAELGATSSVTSYHEAELGWALHF